MMKIIIISVFAVLAFISGLLLVGGHFARVRGQLTKFKRYAFVWVMFIGFSLALVYYSFYYDWGADISSPPSEGKEDTPSVTEKY